MDHNSISINFYYIVFKYKDVKRMILHAMKVIKLMLIKTWDTFCGSAVVEYLSVTALCPLARHINSCLLLVQPRKTRPYLTEKLFDWDVNNIEKFNIEMDDPSYGRGRFKAKFLRVRIVH